MSQAEASTIFALSTAPGRAGIAVVRVSGPQVQSLLARMLSSVPKSRQAAFRTIRHPSSGDEIDKAVVVWFAAPLSETGEDVAEFQVHGSPAVVRSLLEALATQPECRLAEPGEFVRRAFENGKLDLAEVEGLADLIDAETDAQRRQALAQAGGVTSKLYESWRGRLIEVAALTEAAIDFSDEGDVAGDALQEARLRAKGLQAEINQHLNDQNRGEILRDGFRVALLGPPNAGKSSLLNALARREAAIVSAEAGTTRDVIEVRLDLGGLPVIISDTAGIRDSAGEIEREGIRRSFAVGQSANLVLWLRDPASQETDSPLPTEFSRETSLEIQSKADLSPQSSTGFTWNNSPDEASPLAVSSRTGAGLESLTSEIARRAGQAIGTSDGPVITRARHRACLQGAEMALLNFLGGPADAIELRAEDARRAAHELGRITGRVDVEDVLGEIFGRFCIGK